MNPFWLPVVAAQGLWVRSSIEMLPSATGPTTGTVGDPAAEAAPEATSETSANTADVSQVPLRIGILGESTAAGCGVGTHDEGFAGSFARELGARAGRPVRWEVIGQHGATTRRIRYRLLPRLGTDLDVAVLLAGVNDVLGRRTPEQWGTDLAAIVDELAERAEHVLMAGVPPFDAFTSLPSTLGRYLAERADALDEVSQRICAAQPRATWVSADHVLPMGPEFFASDGFHPSAFGYRRLAEAVAEYVKL